MPNEWGTAGFVPGLKTRITSAELRSHMQARSAYHAKRRDEKQAQLPQLSDAVEKIKAQQPAQVVAQFNKSGSGNYKFDGDDAVESLKNDIENHNNKSIAFAFLADHLFDQDYCLERTDLLQLEILKT